MRILNWVKKLLVIVENYDTEQEKMRRQITRAVQMIRSRTGIHADIGYRPSESQVILIGRYKNRDYIQVHDLQAENFEQIIHHLKDLEQYGEIRKVDAPIGFNAVVERYIRH